MKIKAYRCKAEGFPPSGVAILVACGVLGRELRGRRRGRRRERERDYEYRQTLQQCTGLKLRRFLLCESALCELSTCKELSLQQFERMAITHIPVARYSRAIFHHDPFHELLPRRAVVVHTSPYVSIFQPIRPSRFLSELFRNHLSC